MESPPYSPTEFYQTRQRRAVIDATTRTGELLPVSVSSFSVKVPLLLMPPPLPSAVFPEIVLPLKCQRAAIVDAAARTGTGCCVAVDAIGSER